MCSPQEHRPWAATLDSTLRIAGTDGMDDQRTPEEHRNAASHRMAAGDEADTPVRHRVQSPTSGHWHPCDCSRRRDHLGVLRAVHTPEGAQHSPESAAQWHIAPPDADRTDHLVDQSCAAHIDAASRDEVPFGGWTETRVGKKEASAVPPRKERSVTTGRA